MILTVLFTMLLTLSFSAWATARLQCVVSSPLLWLIACHSDIGYTKMANSIIWIDEYCN